MKRKLGVLVLIVSSLVISAGCASTNKSPKPNPPQPDSGENWAQARFAGSGRIAVPLRR
jgi:hypothetical protein